MRQLLPILLLVLTVAFLPACREEIVSEDPKLALEFSHDTLCFDTVFTTIGSATRRVKVYNRNANALRIDRIWTDSARWFSINVDGENDPERLRDIELRGKDSLFVFVELRVDPQASNSPVFIQDAIRFALNGKTQAITLEAYGQDVHLIRTPERLTVAAQYTFLADKPYLIFDTLATERTMRFEAGAQLYMHDGSVLYAYGNVESVGTLEKPVVLQGDRRDRLFDSVPYRYAAGQWGGLYLLQPAKVLSKSHYNLNYTEIYGANVGLYCLSEGVMNRPKLTLTNSRIHNQAIYGLVLQNTDAEVVNTEISNAASYCVYLSGGTHRFVHTTIASYFNHTNIRVQSTPRQDAVALYVNELDKSSAPTRLTLLNSIVTGVKRDQWMLASPLPQYYPETIAGNYLKSDTLNVPHAHDNVYWQESDTVPVFQNDFYEYKVYKYYNFRLDSLSPARGIGDSLTAVPYPTDREGHSRAGLPHPDAGCYQYIP